MITKALRFLYTILLEQTKNMTIVTREQRGRLVFYPYNQGKNAYNSYRWKYQRCGNP
jgi:hypothetical protein